MSEAPDAAPLGTVGPSVMAIFRRLPTQSVQTVVYLVCRTALNYLGASPEARRLAAETAYKLGDEFTGKAPL